MNSNPHLNYRADIDGLRALAIFFVIIFHAYPKFIRGGFIGVDIFFVISGYLITSIILKGLNQQNFSLLDFYNRRIKRIFPSILVVLTFCLISGWYVLLSSEYLLLGKHISFAAIYLSNFLLESESGYFDTSAELKPLLHLWSLSIEEQFYLLFPLILLITFRLRLRPDRTILLFLFVSFLLNIIQVNSNITSTFYFPHTRAWELLIGSYVAYINISNRRRFDVKLKKILFRRRRINKENALANFLSWLGFSLIILAWLTFNPEKILFPGAWALFPTIGTACLILAGNRAWLNKRLFSNKIAVYLGLISYPLYLWHWPLLSFMRIVEMEHPSSMLRLYALLLSLLLAWSTFYFVEKNIRYRKHWSTPFLLLCSLILVGSLGYLVKFNAGFPNRLQNEHAFYELGLSAWSKNGWVKQSNCLKRYGNYDFCLIQDKNKAIETMLIGDSHANHLYPGLLQHREFTSGNLLNIGMGGCLHFLNRSSKPSINEGKHCQELINQAFDVAINTLSIKTIILAGAWSGSLKTKKGFIQKIAPIAEPTNNISNFQNTLRETLNILISANKNIIFVHDTPSLGFLPSNCNPRPWRITGDSVLSPCATTLGDVDSLQRKYLTPIDEVLIDFPEVKVWEPFPAFCDQNYCWAVHNEKMLYRDKDHLNETGSLYLGQYLYSRYILNN